VHYYRQKINKNLDGLNGSRNIVQVKIFFTCFYSNAKKKLFTLCGKFHRLKLSNKFISRDQVIFTRVSVKIILILIYVIKFFYKLLSILHNMPLISIF